MKKHLCLLAFLLAGVFTPAHAQFSGWGYLNSFPWVYLDDRESWAYLFVVDTNYWAYVQDTGDYFYAGEVTSGGDAPESLTGLVLVLQIMDEGELGTGTLLFESESIVTIRVEDGGGVVELTGTYAYERQGADTGELIIEVVDEEDVIDSLFYLIFGEDGVGYYLSLSSDEEELPPAGEDGQYGSFSVSTLVTAGS